MADPGSDPLAALPSDLRTLVERYGRARQELGHALGSDPRMSQDRLQALAESVTLAERRLVEALTRAGA